MVFVEKPHEGEHEEEAHEAHKEEAHDDHDEDEGEHNEHEHGEQEEVPYAPQVVEVIAYTGNEVAVRGITAGTEYVSDGVYFVKSMLLKGALGEHGH